MKDSRENQSASFFRELGGFMKPYEAKYISSVIVSILSVAAGIGAYAFAGRIAGILFEGQLTASVIFSLAAGAAACKIISAVLLNLSAWISHNAAYFTLRDIRLSVSEKLLRLPMGYFEENGSGRLKTMLTDRIEGMEKTLAHMFPELTANIAGPLCCIVWMFFSDWRLALMVLLWICLGFSVTAGMMKGYEEKYAGQIKALKSMNQAVVEYVNGIQVIKNFGRTDECSLKYRDAVFSHASYNVNWQKETQKYSALGMAIAPFSLFPLLAGGLFFWSRGSLESSTLFMTVILSFGIFGPLMNAMNYFDSLASMGTDAKEIRDVLDCAELRRGTEKAGNNFDIDFENVSFSYEDTGEKALNNISFHVPQGSMFALTGPSGGGKSTIAKLLAGFRDPDSGSISIGGKKINKFSQEELNRLIAFVEQDTFLFDESIMDNIKLARPGASDEEAIKAAAAAGCDGFISALPEGYNTRAGSSGCRLSGGEKQRISIVRAMMKDAPVMILDEATASSDPENEASIQRALSAAAQGRTLIVIAHRLSTVKNADKIAYVENGEIRAAGTHSKLLESCPGYRKMWMLSEVETDE